MKQKIALIFGTRPEIIKLSPLIRLFQRKKVPYFMIHSGQHYSYEMDRLFFKELELPEPHYQLGVRSKDVLRQSDHAGRMMIEIEDILLRERPRWVLVQGDTNTVLAGALTTSKFMTTRDYTGIEMNVGHVEAGLRSYDRRMPEEINRFIADHLSELLFAPTALSKRILLKENVPAERIRVTGNTIVDAVNQNRKLAAKKSRILARLGLQRRKYFLLTLHRQENVDDPKRLRLAVKALADIYAKYRLPIVFPVHPRTTKQLKRFRIALPRGIVKTQPLGYLDFLALEAGARLILTDSGGLQEEAMILRVPCVTLRESTERPETVSCGANVLTGLEPRTVLLGVRRMMAKKASWKNALGDGRASERILAALRSYRAVKSPRFRSGL